MQGDPPTDGRALWRSYGIEVDDAWRWVAVLRRHAMPLTTQNAGRHAWPRMDWSVVTCCLIEGRAGQNPDAPLVRAWLRSRIPIDRVEYYLPAGLSLDEALRHEADDSYDQRSLTLMAALRTRLTGRS